MLKQAGGVDVSYHGSTPVAGPQLLALSDEQAKMPVTMGSAYALTGGGGLDVGNTAKLMSDATTSLTKRGGLNPSAGLVMSDEKAKKPVSDAEAARLSAVADKAFAGTAADQSGGMGSLVAALSQMKALGKTKPAVGPDSEGNAELDGALSQMRALGRTGPAVDGSQGRFTAPPRDEMSDAARAMHASSYAYRPEMTPPDQAPGEPNVGPMAQNMAANPVTATAVKRDPRTGLLMIDQSKMLKVLGGVAADQQDQIDALRRRKGG
jgi:hypothetical protein